MKKNKVVTIGREFGSGGREIGRLLSERLGIPMYDTTLVKMAAEELGIREQTAQAVDETTLNSFLTGFVLSPIEYSKAINNEEYTKPLSEQIYELQSLIIKRLAQKGPCVIVGRCADFILKDEADCISVFICADMEERVRRIAERYDISEKKAADKIKRIERERRYYYESRTGLYWGDIDSYQMLLNASRLGVEGTVDVLEAIYKLKE